MPPCRLRVSVLLAAVVAAVLGVGLGIWIGGSYGERRSSDSSKPRGHSDSRATAGVAAPHPPLAPAAALPPPAAKFMPGVVVKTTGTDGVALTFDDGPDNQTMAILDLLRANGVKATFCVIGENVQQHPDLVQAIVRDGHSLCNHTWNHDLDLGQRSTDEIRADLQKTSDEIHKAVPGAPIKYFRHPGGNFTPTAVQVAQDMGMTSIDWDIDPTDWDTGTYSVGPTMISQIVGTIENGVQPGSIVLSHDGGGDRTSTVAAYEMLLPYLIQEKHLRLVPLPTS